MITTVYTKTSHGFTAVELLITLFVAAAFLVAGYQLFNVVIKDGGATRLEAEASNVAYQHLRRHSTAATNPCTPLTPAASEPVSLQGTNNATVSATITCPQADAPSISQLEVIVTYGVGVDANTVKIATFVDGSTR
ncbi:MAG: PulJ/GspJ family protein [Candidatus Microsaccharimonas sp.]